MERFDRSRQALAITVAFLAGLVDALGFMAGDRYFVSFMSGNTTRLAVDLASAPGRASVPALLIMGFVAGVASGSVLAAKAQTWRKPALLAAVTSLLVLAAMLDTWGHVGGALAAMVTAMGAVNNLFHRTGEPTVGLTYMTGALVKLGQAIGAWLSGQEPAGWAAYTWLWCGLFSGAVAGALSFSLLGGAALWLASLLAAALTAWAWQIVHGDRRQPSI